MRRMIRVVFMVSIGLTMLSQVAFAQPVINFNPQVFRVGQAGGLDVSVPAVETLTTGADFYDFRSASSHMGFEEVGLSLLLLHRDARDGAANEVSLIITHGIDQTTELVSQPTASNARLVLRRLDCRPLLPDGARPRPRCTHYG